VWNPEWESQESLRQDGFNALLEKKKLGTQFCWTQLHARKKGRWTLTSAAV
jgi:hypothetical protein